MTENVESLIKNLSNQKEELRQIISSVNAGIVVCYKNLSILIYNKIFEKMIKENYLELENEYLKNKNFFEIMKDKKGNIELINIINDTLKTKKNNTKEIIIDKKTYILTVASILSNENIVMIFHDITDLKKSEIIKKEFVQNVTHELKTPLTSIKAFLETMEDEKEYNKKYISIIQNNIDRMVNIINDLLTLSEIENHKMKLDIEKINIKEMLDNIIELFEKKASGKNIFLKMKLEIDEVGVFLNGDKFRLEQVFINILDNAIKYTEKGEIIIYIENEKNYINVSIKDTGFGILEEHLDRIFERFYVVDKSRSKKLGGTGLGLSIVKHIVLLHKGTIKVESKIGVGSTFAIKLPRSLL
jgi:two-component system phosphate regulon sensor histidine kinase PhoR